MLLSEPLSKTPTMALSNVIGTMRRMTKGRLRLSYWAAKTRKTNRMHRGKMYTAVFPAMRCWQVNSVHS